MGVHYFLFSSFLCILKLSHTKFKKIEILFFIFDPAIPFFDICPPVPKDTCTEVLIIALFGLERKIAWKQCDESIPIINRIVG